MTFVLQTFIVVRPPPSVSNHPLNLQLQLVPPQTKDRSVSISSSSTRRSLDSVSAAANSQEDNNPLSRVSSARSNRSDVSTFYSSSISVTSSSSLASAGSSQSGGIGGRRMIVPLYNLSAHNVLTNTVLDAGTDAKIAKFHKRSLDIMGLVILEPLEIWPGFSPAGAAHHQQEKQHQQLVNASGLRRSASRDNAALLHPYNPPAGREYLYHEGSFDPESQTPTSSALSLSSAGHAQPLEFEPADDATPKSNQSSLNRRRNNVSNVETTPTPSNSAKKIFGKLFRSKASNSPTNGEQMSPSASDSSFLSRSPGFSPLRSNRRAMNASAPGGTASPPRSPKTLPSPLPSAGFGPSSSIPSGLGGRDSHTNVAGSSTAVSSSAGPILQPPILGIQPTLVSPVNPPVGRATKYVWVVRKWVKGNETGILGGMKKGVGVLTSVVADRGMGGIGGGGPFGFGGSNSNQAAAYANVPLEQLVEVRIEWVRGRHRRSSQMKRNSVLAANASSGAGGAGGSQTSSLSHQQSNTSTLSSRRSRSSVRGTANVTVGGRKSLDSLSARARSNSPPASAHRRAQTQPSQRPTSLSHEHDFDNAGGGPITVIDEDGKPLVSSPKASFSTHRTSMGGFPEDGVGAGGDDPGDESDPEDSETPWTCGMLISRVGTQPSLLPSSPLPGSSSASNQNLNVNSLAYAGPRSRASYASSSGMGGGGGSEFLHYNSNTASPNLSPSPSHSGFSSQQHHSPSASHQPPPLARVKLATLLPAPHHPKIVAQLKVPFPLPDIDISKVDGGLARVRKRVVTAQGIARSQEPSANDEFNSAVYGALGGGGMFGGGGIGGSGNGGGFGGGGGGTGNLNMTLTAEEIKDIVSCTAFWLVVREGFGGSWEG